MIDCFRGKYFRFSNMAPVPFGIIYENLVFPTVEHFYHAGRTLQHQARQEILDTPSPYLAKQIGHSFEMRGLEREDWHEINVPHMENGLRQKFSLIVFEKFILDTGNEELIEGNWWHDNFWGSCNCEKCKERFPNGGLNTLGNLLMKIRKEKQNEK